MVDLPTIPDVVPEVRAPQSRVSPAEIAQPFMELGQNLDKAGQALSKDVAEPLARQAGLTAVTRDDQGNITVDRPPLVGDAAVAFSRAVKFSALAQGENEAKRQDLLLSRQYHQDPEGYVAASNAFRESLVRQYTKAAGPEVGIALGRSIDAATNYNYRWLLLEQQRTIKHNFDRDTTAAIQSKEEDLFSLIQAGGLDTPEGRQEANRLINERIAITHERVTNPVLGAPREAAVLDLKRFDERVGAARFSAAVEKVLKDPAGGVESAQQMVDSALKDGSLSPAQKTLNYAIGLKTIKEYQNTVIRAAHVNATMQKQTDDMFENAVIADRASDKPVITENDIKTNGQVSAAAKMRMLAWVKRDGMPEPLAESSHLAAMDLFRRMNLPEGDAGKITSLTPIRDAYAPSDGSRGKLTRADEEWLERRFLEARTPEGDRLTQIRTQFSHSVAPSIDKSNPMLGKIDQSGKLQTYAFERFVDQKVDEYRKAGKSPFDLFDPSKADYLGKPEIVQRFAVPLQQSIKNMTRSLTGRPASSPDNTLPSAAPATTQPQRKPGESVADYLARIGAR